MWKVWIKTNKKWVINEMRNKKNRWTLQRKRNVKEKVGQFWWIVFLASLFKRSSFLNCLVIYTELHNLYYNLIHKLFRLWDEFSLWFFRSTSLICHINIRVYILVTSICLYFHSIFKTHISQNYLACMHLHSVVSFSKVSCLIKTPKTTNKVKFKYK